jgi:hypothetical protein
LERLARQLSEPPRPIMSDEEYAQLDPLRHAMLVCNWPGCGKVVCTHGLLCVQHTEEMSKEPTP